MLCKYSCHISKKISHIRSVTSGIIFILAARRTMHRYSALEQRFLSNLNEKEEAERRSHPVSTSLREKMTGYDVHLEPLEVSPDSVFAGKQLKDIPFRAETGANLVKIRRGNQSITIPSGEVRIYPYDKLLAVGSSDQIDALRAMLSRSNTAQTAAGDLEFEVVSLTLEADSFLTGKTLRNVNMRQYRCMVISVLHNGEFITNPEPDFQFGVGDVVWIAGETSSLPYKS